ncbi:NAD(P)-dependent oxidoreductase [Oceanicoccus sp. KOV_DT_Chl]|uniref:NAD(P)-dependent oxidoreductase n=1 Tax=Oceanicoccus sp. KOV_DT_Chl TaxID=1904639 RepID=UPI000C796D4E|nr:NAD(P)H-binding protein [Oceanicoccus sp. KOV_DT_Chl]
MQITILGATGDLGRECLQQSVEAGHAVTVLVRSPEKLPAALKEKITVIQGDGLSADDVQSAMPAGTDAILFAVGVDEKTSPQNLCTDVTRNVLEAMRKNSIPKLVWCGGGSNLRKEDVITFGAKFVRWYSEIFLKLRHTDKENQLALLDENSDLNWVGIRPLQMIKGTKKTVYRLGYNAFSGTSKIHFADCAHAMVAMLEDDTWTGKVPIIQY